MSLWRWPWNRDRTAAAEPRNYGELVDQLVYWLALDAGDEADARLSGPVEACARLYSNALAGAEVEASAPVAAALSPRLLGLAGRAFVLRGEFVATMDTRGGRLQLHPGVIAEAFGGPANPSYRVRVGGPVTSTEQMLAEPQLVHAVFAADVDQPHTGAPPWLRGGHATRALAALERSIGHEANGGVGHTYPSPRPENETGQQETQAGLDSRDGLAQRLTRARGRVQALQTQQVASWRDATNPPASVVDRLWRFGPEFAEAYPRLYQELRASVAAACGVPPQLLAHDVQSASVREAYRWWLQASVKPVGDLLGAELSDKLGTPVAITFPGMTAADVQGRTRAVKQLVEAGVDLERAMALVGLEG